MPLRPGSRGAKPPARRRVRDAAASRASVFAAAAAEFAARGFDGAKVDRIAATAGVNKAMIYYHFKSKARLYNAILHDTFAAIAEAVREVRASGGPADAQIRTYVATIARVADDRPFFPPIWLREVAEGGRHLEPSVAVHFREVLSTLTDILREGQAAGTMRPAHPFLVQLGIVGPLTLFIASKPLRDKFEHVAKAHLMDVSMDAVVEHVQAMALGGISRIATARKSR